MKKNRAEVVKVQQSMGRPITILIYDEARTLVVERTPTPHERTLLNKNPRVFCYANRNRSNDWSLLRVATFQGFGK